MSNMNFGSLWTLMSKYRFLPHSDSTQDDFTCLICGNLMIDCFQSGCGCQYCYECIQEFLVGESKHCPGTKMECKEEYLSLDYNVFRNALLNRKLSKLKVHCPNESCQCINELSIMEDHLKLCMKPTVDCPYLVLGCDNGIQLKEETTAHDFENTLNDSYLLLEFIQNIKNEVCILKEESKKHTDDLEMTKSMVISLQEKVIEKENIIEELNMEVSRLKDDFEQSKLEIVLLKESKAEDTKVREVKREIELLKIEFTSTETEIKEVKKEIELFKNVSTDEKSAEIQFSDPLLVQGSTWTGFTKRRTEYDEETAISGSIELPPKKKRKTHKVKDEQKVIQNHGCEKNDDNSNVSINQSFNSSGSILPKIVRSQVKLNDNKCYVSDFHNIPSTSQQCLQATVPGVSNNCIKREVSQTLFEYFEGKTIDDEKLIALRDRIVTKIRPTGNKKLPKETIKTFVLKYLTFYLSRDTTFYS